MRSLKSKYATRLALCAALFAIGAVTASAASATGYVYKVKGTTLGTGVKKEITSKSTKEFVMRWNFAGRKYVASCSKEKLNTAAKPAIVGGTPGKTEKEIMEFEGCTGTINGEGCGSLEGLEKVPVNSELVTVVEPVKQAGKLATLFTPTTEERFAILTWNGCGPSGIEFTPLTGSMAALNTPEKVEQVTGKLLWNELEQIEKIKRSSGTETHVVWQLDGEVGRIDGEAEIKLVSAENWGVF